VDMLLLAQSIRPKMLNLVTLVMSRRPELYSNYSRSKKYNDEKFICFAAVRLDKMTYKIISRYFSHPRFVLIL